MTDSEIKANWEDNLESLRKERAKKSEQVLQQANSASLPQFDDAFDAALTDDLTIPASSNTAYVPSPPASATLAEQHTEISVKSARATSGGEGVVEFIIKQEESVELGSEKEEIDNLFYTYDKFDASSETVDPLDVGEVEFVSLNQEVFIDAIDDHTDSAKLNLVDDDGYLSSWQKETGRQTNTVNEIVPAGLTLSGDVDLSDDSLLVFEPEITLAEPEIVLTMMEQPEIGIAIVTPEREDKSLDAEPFKEPDHVTLKILENNQENKAPEIAILSEEQTIQKVDDTPYVSPSIFSIPIFSIDREDAKKQATQKQEASVVIEETNDVPIDSEKATVNPLRASSLKAQQENQPSVESLEEIQKTRPSMQDLTIERDVSEALNNGAQGLKTEEAILSEAELTEIMDDLLRPVGAAEVVAVDSIVALTDVDAVVTQENRPAGQPASYDRSPMLEIDPIFTIDEDPEFISQAIIHQHVNNDKQADDSDTTVIEISSIYPIEVGTPPPFARAATLANVEKTKEVQSGVEEPPSFSVAPSPLASISALTDEFLDELAQKLVAPMQEALLACLRQELSQQLPEILKTTIKAQLKQNPELLNIQD